MREPVEGSQAVAAAVARCRPGVVPAYPITPQTHIVEAIGVMCRDGRLPDTRFMTVESEFSALSAALGASAVGSRSYTATASQGLLYMTEVLFSVAGLGFPVVMTVANRAVGAPINIWNDHSDSMAVRDCGWVQVYAADNQQAVDLHPVAFRLAEQIGHPVMVCVDGFVLTHAVEPLEVPSQDQVDRFLPPWRPQVVLDPADPVTIGALVGPEAFTEARVLADEAQRSALRALTWIGPEWERTTGRPVHSATFVGPPDARTVVVALGSVTGTVREVLGTREDTGLLELTVYRPFPRERVRSLLHGRDRVLVLERATSPGATGPVTADVVEALRDTGVVVHTAVAGLGGRPVHAATIAAALDEIVTATRPTQRVLDLRHDVVTGERHRLVHRRPAAVTAP